MEPTDFETIIRCVMRHDPDLPNWQVVAGLGVLGVTPGRAPAGERGWQPDRERLIQLVRRTVELTGSHIADDVMRERLGQAAEIGRGWYPLVAAFDEMCREAGHPVERYLQIKQKFGGARIYHRGDEYSHDLELTAGWLSLSICEVCGRPGQRSNEAGWLATRCDQHAGEQA